MKLFITPGPHSCSVEKSLHDALTAVASLYTVLACEMHTKSTNRYKFVNICL